MYLYEIEKIIPQIPSPEDITMLTDILSNAEEMHIILGQLFGVSGVKNWRADNNILYMRVDGSTAKFIVQSDIPIDKQMTEKMKFKVTDKNMSTVRENNTVKLKLCVSTFRYDRNKNRKIFIRTLEDRIKWIKGKFAKAGAGNVTSCIEVHPVMNYMAHKLVQNSAEMLRGFVYEIQLEITDTDAFIDLLRKGIGPSKAYGFGLVEII